MAQKRAEYRSSRRSKNMIKKAFAKLLHEKDLSKITVTDIIKEAEISRGTFYAHYPDVYGLLEQIENEEMTKLMNFIYELGFESISDDPTKLIKEVVNYINSDLEYYKLLFLSKSADRFLIRIKNFMTDQILSNEVIALYHASSTGEASIYISFFTAAVASVFIDWLKGNIDVTIDELTDTLSRIITNALISDKTLMARIAKTSAMATDKPNHTS